MFNPVFIAISLVILACFAGLAAYISGAKGRAPLEGAIFGVLLGPLGPVVAALMPAVRKPEPRPATETSRAMAITTSDSGKQNPWAEVAVEPTDGEFVDTVLPSRRSIRTASVVSSNEDDLMRLAESPRELPNEPDPTARRSLPSLPSRGLRVEPREGRGRGA